MNILVRYVNQWVLLVALLGFAATQAFALDATSAKQQGLVGESSTGYLEAVTKKVSPEVKALLDEVNRKRKKKYEQIAKANKIPVASVEKMGATKAFKKTKPGLYIKKGGAWVKK